MGDSRNDVAKSEKKMEQKLTAMTNCCDHTHIICRIIRL